MSRKTLTFSFILFNVLLTLIVMLVTTDFAQGDGATSYPWPSWRHDLLNTAAAPDSGYPTTNPPPLLWKIDRSDRPDIPGMPAAAGGPVAVDKGMVFTTGKGIVETVDQFTGKLIWSRAFPWEETLKEPDDVPYDWCFNDIPTLGFYNTGICYVPDIADCPSWCMECTTEEPDCSRFFVTNPLPMPEGYGQFLSGSTLDTENNCLIFGTFDGRVISLNMETGDTNWERTPFKDPGGPNENRPWYDQKFAWHLSPPAIHNGHVYIGSFLPGFYWIFRGFPFLFDNEEDPYHPTRLVKPSPSFHSVGGDPGWGSNFGTFWAGHDGWFYALDENDGSILWSWDPQGCGIANIPPVDSEGNVYVNDDFHADYCHGLFRSFKSNGEHNWTFGPTPVAQGGTQSISGDTIFFPNSDGVLWALNKNTGALRWTFHGGFLPKGESGLTSSAAIDEEHGWVLGASDTGRIFVLDKKTGRLVREAYLGVPDWNPGDDIPSEGFWFPGSGSMAIVPKQTLL
ncbi:MAG: PQQ-like beta-propeller repeat protein, partial [Deltaproteobacteria bacterium]|nr:PQQ-like beta-propeller repeat protein [Deltaproteobacteria bacterium]